jgi:hypothetical protein
MEDQLHINRQTIRPILHEDLEKRKKCVKFVPHGLVEKQEHKSRNLRGLYLAVPEISPPPYSPNLLANRLFPVP